MNQTKDGVPAGNSACSDYLVPADTVHAWYHSERLHADKQLGDRLTEFGGGSQA